MCSFPYDCVVCLFFFKQKTAYEMRISDWSSDVCSSDLLTLKLKPREERRLRAGHLWVYSNEIDVGPEFRQIAPGTLCRVHDSRDKPLGVGYVNPRTLLSARLLSDKADCVIDASWFAQRLPAALVLREQIYREPYYLLVHGEGDGLPVLLIDPSDRLMVVQITPAGREARNAMLREALQGLGQPP